MWANGEAPLTSLVHVANNIWLPAGTLARWNWAVEQGAAKYGARLRITGQNSSAWNTWNGYRPKSAQQLYKNAYGNLAASVGKSSHGLTYGGRQCAALDVDNWRDLAPGNESLAWARFVALMRLAGLTTDFVTPREQWHVGDFNDIWTIPAFAAPAAAGSATDLVSEEDDMRIIAVNDSVYAIAREFISRLNKAQVREGEAMYGKAIGLGRGDANSEAGTRLRAQLDFHGVPRTVLDANGFVLNPQANRNKGAFESNGTWSRSRELLARK